MSSDEKSSFIKFLVEQVESKDEQIKLVQERLEQIIEQLHKSEKNQNGLQATINTLSKQLQETLFENQRLHLKLEKSMAEGSIAKKHLFGSMNQKGISPKKQADNGREKDRDEFDGTGGSLNSYITSDTPLQSETPGIATDQMNSSCSTTITFSRKGWRYRKMNADEKVLHASCNLLFYLAFNKYHMETPLYRKIVRLLNERMHISRMTLNQLA